MHNGTITVNDDLSPGNCEGTVVLKSSNSQISIKYRTIYVLVNFGVELMVIQLKVRK